VVGSRIYEGGLRHTTELRRDAGKTDEEIPILEHPRQKILGPPPELANKKGADKAICDEIPSPETIEERSGRGPLGTIDHRETTVTVIAVDEIGMVEMGEGGLDVIRQQ